MSCQRLHQLEGCCIQHLNGRFVVVAIDDECPVRRNSKFVRPVTVVSITARYLARSPVSLGELIIVPARERVIPVGRECEYCCGARVRAMEGVVGHLVAGEQRRREFDDEGGAPYKSATAFCCLPLLCSVEVRSQERIAG